MIAGYREFGRLPSRPNGVLDPSGFLALVFVEKFGVQEEMPPSNNEVRDEPRLGIEAPPPVANCLHSCFHALSTHKADDVAA